MSVFFYDLWHKCAIVIDGKTYVFDLPKWLANMLNKLHKARQRAKR